MDRATRRLGRSKGHLVTSSGLLPVEKSRNSSLASLACYRHWQERRALRLCLFQTDEVIRVSLVALLINLSIPASMSDVYEYIPRMKGGRQFRRATLESERRNLPSQNDDGDKIAAPALVILPFSSAHQRNAIR